MLLRSRLSNWFLKTGIQPPNKKLLRGLAIVFLVLLGLLLLWIFTPMASWKDPQMLRAELEKVQDHAAWPLIFAAAYLLGGLVMFPVTVLNMTGVLLLGPWQGFQYAWLGNMGSAALNYFLIRFLGARMLGDLSEQKLISWSRRFAKNELLSMILIRNLPVSFGLVSMFAAVSRFSVRDYFLGTMLGMLPGLILVCFLAEGLRQFILAPDLKLLLLILAAGLTFFLVGRMLKRHLQRRAESAIQSSKQK